MTKVGYELREEVAVLSLQSAPGNALTRRVRQDLGAALERALTDAGAKAILILGQGRTFCDGNDLAEYERPERDPSLRDLCKCVEDATKPVIAAIHGNALGAGMELALAAHFRVAEKNAQIGLPEVALGLVPAGGATQRLPRLGGAALSLAIMTGGRPMRASDPAAKPVVDALFEGNRAVAGLAFCRKLMDDGREIRRTRDMRKGFDDPLEYQAEIARMDKALGEGPEIARREILRCVEAAQLLPFDVGVAFEAEIAEHCRAGGQSRALRHLMRSERRAARPQQAHGGAARPVNRVGLVGGGTRAAALAILALDHRQDVQLHVRDDEMAARFERSIEAHYRQQIDKGLVSEADATARMQRLNIGQDLAEVARSELVVETTGASAQDVAGLAAQIAGLGGDDVVIAITSGQDALQEASAVDLARGRVLGLRLRDPANLARLIEVAAPEGAGADALATLIRWIETQGRVSITTPPRATPVGQEMIRCWQAMALALADEGVHPFDIDRGLTGFGHKAGPFLAMDQEGLPSVREGIAELGLPRSVTLDALIDAGRTGRREGQGLYTYPEGAKNPVPDDGIEAHLPDRDRTRIEPAVIVHLCNAALANCGARLLGQGDVALASDLDVAMVAGWGYPRLRGGPMITADIAGLFQVQRLLEQFARTTQEPRWAPDPHLRNLVKNGEGFAPRV